jgi:hypothetical protein
VETERWKDWAEMRSDWIRLDRMGRVMSNDADEGVNQDDDWLKEEKS